MNDFSYVGSELEMFAAAHNWKMYCSRQIRPFVIGDVLEVGAGIGSNTPFLDPGGITRWVCLEPDLQQSAQLERSLNGLAGSRAYETVCGTLRSLDPAARFDTIIYVDVLEHIEDDRAELDLAAARLRPGGCIVVLSPAHSWLFSPFDAAIGHHRRYTRSILRNLSPATVRFEHSHYVDSAGLAASAANRLFLRQSMPTAAQLRFWDCWLIPISRVLDRLLLRRVGKSILAVWRKP